MSKCKTRRNYKSLRGNHRQYTLWQKSQQDPLWPTSQSIGNKWKNNRIKAKITKWDLIKLKRFCIMKETLSKVQRQPSEWEEIIANEGTDRELIWKNIQAVHAAQYQKNKQPNQKIGHRTIRHFSKEGIQMANKHMKRCSTSLIIREMWIKTTKRYHHMPVRMAAIKKFTNNKCWRGCGEKGTLLHCWWECKLVQPLSISISQKYQ